MPSLVSFLLDQYLLCSFVRGCSDFDSDNNGGGSSSSSFAGKGNGSRRKPHDDHQGKCGLMIGYCTATGTAKRMAHLAAADAQENHLNVFACSCVSELSPGAVVAAHQQQQQQLLPDNNSSSDDSESQCPTLEYVLLLFVATQGDGEAPSTWDLFKRTFEAETFSSNSIRCVGFHVVALGDSSYRRFCEAGKKAEAWLSLMMTTTTTTSSLSSTLSVSGDDDNDGNAKKKNRDNSNITLCDARLGAAAAEELVDGAVAKLYSNLRTKFSPQIIVMNDNTSSSTNASTRKPFLAPLSCSLRSPSEKPPKKIPFPAPASIQPSSAERPVEIPVIKVNTVSDEAKGAARTVVQLIFDATNLTTRTPVQAGDHLAIYVENSPGLAVRCAKALRIPPEQWNWTLSVNATVTASNRASAKELLPASISLIDALRCYPDLSGPPRRRLVSRVLSILPGEAERQQVRQVVATKPFCNSVDVLEAAAAALTSTVDGDDGTNSNNVLSLEEFFFVCPRLLPRFFSVSDIWRCDDDDGDDDGKTLLAPTAGAVTGGGGKKSKKSNSAAAAAAAPLPFRISVLVALAPNGCFARMVRDGGVLSHQSQSTAAVASSSSSSSSPSQMRFFAFLRRTTFHPSLPSVAGGASSSLSSSSSSSSSRPILMIGAGTGIAPFLGFCRELAVVNAQKRKIYRASNATTEKKSTDATIHHHRPKTAIIIPTTGLVYGFTTRGVGSPFLDDFRRMVGGDAATTAVTKPPNEDGVDGGGVCFSCPQDGDEPLLSFLEEAESRPAAPVDDVDDASAHVGAETAAAPSRTKKQYVQDRIAARAADLFADLIVEKRCAIFICGRSAMAVAVEEAIEKSVLIGACGMSAEGAAKFMAQLRQEQRLRLDCWES